MAMQAGVPVVPIVMRNCGEIMGAHSMAIHPGTVDVAVLPPVPTDDWTLENLNDNIARVRQMYLDTLANWPSPTA
jgi:putative phosphoserine phosphatase/1-acylglycerol-3-phosphate O-acyltransferase